MKSTQLYTLLICFTFSLRIGSVSVNFINIPGEHALRNLSLCSQTPMGIWSQLCIKQNLVISPCMREPSMDYQLLYTYSISR